MSTMIQPYAAPTLGGLLTPVGLPMSRVNRALDHWQTVRARHGIVLGKNLG